MGQSGNVWEWNENAWDGSNNSSSEDRALSGGGWNRQKSYLRSSYRFNGYDPTLEDYSGGFRVASVVPEPSATLLALSGLGAMLAKRRRQS